MFKNLRFKLTLVNIVVVGFIILIVIVGASILTKMDVARQSSKMMHVIATEALTVKPNRFTQLQRRWSNYFYAKVDKKGNIIASSPELPVTEEQLKTLVDKIMQQDVNSGVLKLGSNESYKFLSVTKEDNSSTVMVLVNTESENEFFTRLLATLSMIGIGVLVLAFIGSLFMAERALIPIKNAWEKQKNFIADASHELRSPLTVIQTNLELVLSNPENTVESQRKWLEYIMNENKRMTKLVNDLLFLARNDSKQEKLLRSNFALDSELKRIYESYEPLAASKGIKLEAYMHEDINFYGDENNIRQLVLILLDNALKYTTPGGSIRVELKEKEANVEISISDTGIGIEKVHLNKIFERFYRVDKARTRLTGGSGLGLSIAECIVKEHHGTISVASTPGKGTTFTVILPKVK